MERNMGRRIANAARAGLQHQASGSGGRPRSSAADRAILKAALKLFVKRGFDSTSFEEIAETAGVAKTTVYRRWSSKEDLIAQAIASERGNPERKIVAREARLGSLKDSMIDAVAEVLTTAEYKDITARLIGSVPDHPELMSVYWRLYLEPRRRLVGDILARARDAGLIRRDVDIELLLDLLGGAVLHELLVRPGKRTSAELRAYLHKAMRELGIDGGRPLAGTAR